MKVSILLVRLLIFLLPAVCCVVAADAQTMEIIVPKTHNKEVKSYCVSPNGKFILTNDAESLLLWEAETGQSLAKIEVRLESSNNYDFSPSSEKFVYIKDSIAHITSTKDLSVLKRLKLPGALSVYFSTETALLVVYTSHVDMRDAATGKLLRTLLSKPVYGAREFMLSTDRRFLCFINKAIFRTLDLQTGRETTYKDPNTTHPESEISRFAFNNARTVVVVSYQLGVTIAYSVATGKRIIELGKWRYEGYEKMGIIDSNGEEKMYYTYMKDSVQVMLGPISNDYYYGAANIVFSADDKLVSVQALDTAVTFSMATGKSVRTIKLPADIRRNITRFSPQSYFAMDGDKLLMFDDRLNLKDSRNLGIKISQLDNVAYQGGTLVGWDYDRLLPVAVDLKYKSLKSLLNNGIERVNSVCYVADEGRKLLFVGFENFFQCWDLDKGTILLTARMAAVKQSYFSENQVKMELTKDKRYLIVRYEERYTNAKAFDIYRTANLEKIGTIQNVEYFQLSDNNMLLFNGYDAKTKYTNTGLFDIEKRRVTELAKDTARVYDIGISHNGRQAVQMVGQQGFRVYDLPSGRNKLFPIDSLGSGGRVSITYAPSDAHFMLDYSDSYEHDIFIYDSSTIARVGKMQIYAAVDGISFSDDSKYLEATIEGDYHQAAFTDTVFTTRSDISKKIEYHYAYFMPEVVVDDNYRFVRKLNYLEVSRLTPGKTYKVQAKMYCVDENRALLVTPENYYFAARGFSSSLRFVTRGNIFSFEQFDIKYNRPDKVLQALGSADTALISSFRKAYEKRIRKLGIDTAGFQSGYTLPQTNIINKGSIAFEQSGSLLKLHIGGKDEKSLLDRFNVWVNEVPVFGMKGFNLAKRKKNTLDTVITIKLSEGSNRIETSITNRNGIESYRTPLFVNYKPAQAILPKVYFAGIGINHFEQPGHDLQYSVKDIRDLYAGLKKKFGKALVLVDTLFDERVTVNNIKALKSVLQKTTVDDKVIIAYSGHGLLNKQLDYFLSTYRIDFLMPDKDGLPYEVIEDLADNIPARKKLMFIDACHSGEVDKEELASLKTTEAGRKASGITSGAKGIELEFEPANARLGMQNSFELMKQLFLNVGKSTGATIISAAGGMEYALEKGDLKNGVFTYSILESLNTDEHISVGTLKEKVSKRVEVLTKGAQRPGSRTETYLADWQVW